MELLIRFLLKGISFGNYIKFQSNIKALSATNVLGFIYIKNFYIMKLFFIEIFAAIVKCIPSLALCFTKKTNRYCDLFLLPFKKERYHLSRMPKVEIEKRIWSNEARVYALGSKDFYTYFASEICNAKEFDALYNNAEISRSDKQVLITEIIEKNAYTLSKEQAKKVCLELDCIEVLYRYQFPKFKIELVKELSDKQLLTLLAAITKVGGIKERLDSDVVTYLMNLYAKAEDDQPLYSGIDTFVEALLKERYTFNTTQAEILYKHSQDFLETWINNTSDKQTVLGVLRQFSESVWRRDILQYMYKNCRKAGQHDIMAQIVPFIWTNNGGEYDVKTLLGYLITTAMHPCPNLFYLIRHIDNYELYQTNFGLCVKHNLLHKIDKTETKSFGEETTGIYLLDMAERELLTDEEFKSVTDETLKAKLIKIMEDNAQATWIKKLIHDYNQLGLTQEAIDSLCKQNLCDKALILLIENKLCWVDYYHKQHNLSSGAFYKIVDDSKYYDLLVKQIAKYGITKEEYEALLLSPNKSLAAYAKSFMK